MVKTGERCCSELGSIGSYASVEPEGQYFDRIIGNAEIEGYKFESLQFFLVFVIFTFCLLASKYDSEISSINQK